MSGTQRTTLLLAVVAGAFLLSPLLSLNLNPDNYKGGASRDEFARQKRNSSAVSQLLGEFRTNISDVLFIKTERYLHGGIAYETHMSDSDLKGLSGETAKLEQHQAEVGVADHEHHDHEHEEEMSATLIRPPSADFRGFIGSLQRAVKPWQNPDNPHIHTDGTELLPWYRAMTTMDPHNVRAYAIGSWWLKTRNPEEATAFIREGVENNPDEFQVWNTLGNILYYRATRELRKDEPDREHYRELIREARSAFETAAGLGLDARPKGGPTGENILLWNDYTEEDLRSALRMAVLLEERHADPAEAHRMAVEYERRVGGDGILRRIIARTAPDQEE